MSVAIAEKLAALGLRLPPPTVPVANFIPVARTGNLLFISGQINARDDVPAAGTCLGRGIDLDQGRAAARSAALALLAQVAAATVGNISSIHRFLSLRVFMAATADFSRHPEVANGASDLIVAVFGEAGRHARTAIGVASLPLGAVVEVEGIIELKE
jgi:enamine deaminase RidA (YjgF/YER057c/UK114 family)